jgi:hypothetical protein
MILDDEVPEAEVDQGHSVAAKRDVITPIAELGGIGFAAPAVPLFR